MLEKLEKGELRKLASGAAKPGLYADGGNLYLQVGKGGTCSWLFRYEARKDGRRAQKHLGLGALHTVTPAEAREAARQCRLQLRAGIDPLATAHAAKAEAGSRYRHAPAPGRYSPAP